MMNLRIKFTKKGYLKYISHLDTMRLFQRAFRRGNIPIKYSQGFNPQPKMSIANPLALGIESEEEFMDIELLKKISEQEFIEIINNQLPDGIKILDAKYVNDDKSLPSTVRWSYYEINVKTKNMMDKNLLEEKINEWLNKKEIMFERRRYKKGKEIKDVKNIRPLIGNISLVKDNKNINDDAKYIIRIRCLLKSGDNGSLKPTDFLEALDSYLSLNMEIEMADIKRLNIFTEVDGKIQSPM
ncbi:MAG: DUF2344 domain-containing protein [Tissierellia bacterium]|nr:DUF2344 domain-containing protein [Tissierellia bacterium]